MRLALIIGRKKLAKHFEVLGGLDQPAREVAKGFRELRAAAPADLAEIQLWTSTRGRTRTHRFGSGGGINPDAFRKVEEIAAETTPEPTAPTTPAPQAPASAPVETVTTAPASAPETVTDPTAPKGMQDVLLAGGNPNPSSAPDTTAEAGKKKK